MFSMRFSVINRLDEKGILRVSPCVYKIILNPLYTYVMVSECPVAAVAQW